LLLDQYRKKSQLFGGDLNHNVVLVPLGGDFYYESINEARSQFSNYERLIDYINLNKSMNANVRFGTLSDYFELLKEKNKRNLRTLSGDFFTYADKTDRYWSGYYTSRPFYKRLDRIVEHYLRAAELTFSLSNLKGADNTDLYKMMLIARRNLSIFQHHDGIAGTSKSYVMKDYGNMFVLISFLCKKMLKMCNFGHVLKALWFFRNFKRSHRKLLKLFNQKIIKRFKCKLSSYS
jgi:alpha-mannosidase II